MGCQCLNKKEKESEINNENEGENDNKIPDSTIKYEFNPEEYENEVLVVQKQNDDQVTDLESNIIKDDGEIKNKFNYRTLDLINKIRRDPSSYSNTILDNIQYITNENNELIFKKKVKVLLNKGEEAFRNAAEALKQIQPMKDLIMKDEIAIPLPLSEEEINDNNLLFNQVSNIRRKYNINVYFRNLIKNPEIAVLLLIVDDSLNNPGAKRNAILNPLFRKIGINSKFVGTTFVSHFSFSK